MLDSIQFVSKLERIKKHQKREKKTKIYQTLLLSKGDSFEFNSIC